MYYNIALTKAFNCDLFYELRLSDHIWKFKIEENGNAKIALSFKPHEKMIANVSAKIDLKHFVN